MNRKRQAFTLVEMLVVMTIIGVLTALLLPAISKAKENARQTQCSMNLRSYGVGLHSFAAEHLGTLPMGNYPTGWPSGGLGYTYTGSSYIGQMATWNTATEKETDNPAYEYEWGNFVIRYLSLNSGNARNNDGVFLNSAAWNHPVLWCPSKPAITSNNTRTLFTNYMMMPSNLSSMNWPGYPTRTFSSFSLNPKKIDRVIDGDWGKVQSPAGTFRGPAIVMADLMYKYSPMAQSSATSLISHEAASNHLLNNLLAGANFLQFNGAVAYAPRKDIGSLYWWGVARNWSVCSVIGYYHGDPGGQDPKSAFCPALPDWW